MFSLIAERVVELAESDTGIVTTRYSPNGLILPRMPVPVKPDVFIDTPDCFAL